MTRRLVVTYVALTALALALLATPLAITFANRERERLLFDAQREADTVAVTVDDPLEAHAPLPISTLAESARARHASVLVVDSHGVVLFDSVDRSNIPHSEADAGDIRAALTGTRVARSGQLGGIGPAVIYATVPAIGEGVVNGAVRVTYPTAALDTRVRDTWEAIALLCAAVLAAVALVGVVLARSITRPLRTLEQATDRLGHGDLTARLDSSDGPKELRQVAHTFNRMAAQLDDLIDSQTRFVADAAHQLRTPLTALRLRLENLDAGDDLDHTAVAAASAEVARMAKLIDGLLILARDSALREYAQSCDLAAVARERVDGWSDVARDRGVRIELDAPEHAWGYALPGAAEQLFDNLIDNALSASPPAGTVTVVVRRDASHVDFRVLDEGPGLDDDARERAFDRFWRAPGAANAGTGLGLSIVRQLVEASGGTARLDARAGGGLVAAVTLFAASEPDSADSADSMTHPAT